MKEQTFRYLHVPARVISVLWQAAFIHGICWPVFIVLVSTKHPFCAVDVCATDSVDEKAAWKPTSPASKTTCPSVPPQGNGQTDNCGENARAATTIVSQSHPTVARGCSSTSLLGVLQQSWPVATMLAALPCFQMLALIKMSLKSTSWCRRDIWKVNCCYSCRDQHGAERSPSDPLWALTHIWKAWDLLPYELFEPSRQESGAVCRESTSSKLACAPVLPFSCKCFPHHIYSHQTLWAGFPLTSEGAHWMHVIIHPVSLCVCMCIFVPCHVFIYSSVYLSYEQVACQKSLFLRHFLTDLCW